MTQFNRDNHSITFTSIVEKYLNILNTSNLDFPNKSIIIANISEKNIYFIYSKKYETWEKCKDSELYIKYNLLSMYRLVKKIKINSSDELYFYILYDK